MMNATGEKTRLWLLIFVGVVATLFGQTHAREIFAPSPTASGIFAAQTQASTGENYDGIPYDALDSLLAANTAPSFFEGATYTPKVLQQASRGAGEFHSFPEPVATFESSGSVRAMTGGDKVVRQVLEIPGSYRSTGGNLSDGVFQWIKNPDNTINHRLFVPNP